MEFRAGDVILHLVPQSMEGHNVPQGAFGFALPSMHDRPGRYAYVYRDRVEQAVRRSGRVSLVTLLAHVIVHEIAHVLLGPGMHYDRGIMQPRWQPSHLREMEAGGLIFAGDQARLLRTRVAERIIFDKSPLR
jgi:hypothetical protein